MELAKEMQRVSEGLKNATKEVHMAQEELLSAQEALQTARDNHDLSGMRGTQTDLVFQVFTSAPRAPTTFSHKYHLG